MAKNISEVNSLESEAGIIASLLHNPELIFYSEELEPEHFTNYDNRCVYAAIQELVKHEITKADPYNIIEVLNASEATRKYAEHLTVEKLFELVEISDVIARESVEEYKVLVKNVMNTSFRRDLYQGLRHCIDMCLDGSEEDIQKQVYQIIDDTITAYSLVDEIPAYADIVDDMWAEIKQRQGCGYSGIPFKFPALNDYVTAERGELVIFGAQQKVGKSIMLLNIAVDMLRQGYSVLYIDSELSTRLFTARLFSHISKVSYRDLTSGNYDEEQEQAITAAKEWMKTKQFTHIYMPFFDQKTIFTTVKKVNHRNKIDVIIIDYFKATGNELDAYQTYASMGKCVDLVKNEIAGDMNIVAIGAAQATINNRLADSAKIARNASTIIMLIDKTPEEIEQDGPECGNKKMIVTVNRNGAQMAPGEYIDLIFDGDHISYEQAQQHIPLAPF